MGPHNSICSCITHLQFTVMCSQPRLYHVQIIIQNAALPNVHKTKGFVGIALHYTDHCSS